MIHITAITDEDGSAILLHRGFAVDDSKVFLTALEEFLSKSESAHITCSKAVLVIAVDEVQTESYLERYGAVPPRNGRFASPTEPGMRFPSALAASAHLGFNNNEVALYLSKVRRQFPLDKDAGERVAKVRGVSLMYDADHALAYKD